jgi:hypothetical protein
MTTCRPDVAFASVKLSQSNSCPHKIHYHGLKHALNYLYTMRDDGIYFWQPSPCLDLKEGPLPPIHSNKADLLLDDHPEHNATVAHAYADSDWATCVKTRRSFGGSCIRLAGGTVAYKKKFQPTVAGSSTEAKFMSAYDTGKMILLYKASCGTLIFLRKQQLFSMKTMMHVRPWVMRRSLPHGLVTWTSSTLLLASGLNGTSCFWSVLTPPSIYLIILRRVFK